MAKGLECAVPREVAGHPWFARQSRDGTIEALQARAVVDRLPVAALFFTALLKNPAG